MSKGTFRHRVSFGKRQELKAIGELLRRGCDVYIPLVDDRQVDCVIRRGENDYAEIQIKARSADCQAIDAGRFAAMDISEPRKGYFFIFYSEQADAYWVLPSLTVVKLASQNVKGKNKGKYHINLTGNNKSKGGVYPLPQFEEFRNKFELLNA